MRRGSGHRLRDASLRDEAAALHVGTDSVLAGEKLRRKARWISENVAMRIANGKLDIQPREDPDRFEPRKIRVLHYAGRDKPWKPQARLREGFRDIWQHYHDASGMPATFTSPAQPAVA